MWRGLSLHDEVISMINQGLRQGEVHSVFNKTINLMSENGYMLSLVTKSMDEAPVSIHVNMDVFSGSGILAGEAVSFDKQKITVGFKTIDITGAGSYRLRRGVFQENYPILNKNLEILRHLILSNGPEEKYCFDTMAFQMIVHRAALLKQSFLGGTRNEIIENGRSLLGLGQGLTPTGDDVLMGLFLVLGLDSSPMNRQHKLLERIMEGRMEETTDVSYQGLMRASQGFYRSILVEAAEALTSPADIQDILLKVLSIGHSSGRDLLYGMQTGYEIMMEKENGNVN